MRSEAKILKGMLWSGQFKEHKMDQAIISVEPKIDCDNLEQYFMQQGGGPGIKRTPVHVFVSWWQKTFMREAKLWKI